FGRDRIEEVPEHASVDVAVLLLGGATRPGCEEDVRRGRATHRFGNCVGVLEIRDERRDSLVEAVRVTAESRDVPTVRQETACNVSPDDDGRAGDERASTQRVSPPWSAAPRSRPSLPRTTQIARTCSGPALTSR